MKISPIWQCVGWLLQSIDRDHRLCGLQGEAKRRAVTRCRFDPDAPAGEKASSGWDMTPLGLEIFEQAYHGGLPPWEIGRAQQEFAALEEAGEIVGDVLDVGCGTGENALYLAGRGHEVWGVDAVPAAIERARQKAEERGAAATFLVADALDLTALGRTFETVIDSGLFHALSDADRPRFVRSLAPVLSPGGTCFMLAISEFDSEGPVPSALRSRRFGRPSPTGGGSTGSGPRPSRAASARRPRPARGSRRSRGYDLPVPAHETRSTVRTTVEITAPAALKASPCMAKNWPGLRSPPAGIIGSRGLHGEVEGRALAGSSR